MPGFWWGEYRIFNGSGEAGSAFFFFFFVYLVLFFDIGFSGRIIGLGYMG